MLCMPELEEAEREKLVRASVISTLTNVFATASVWFRGLKWHDRHITGVENRDLFDAALAEDRGLLLLIPHFGNWELAGMWASRFRTTTAIYRKPRMEFLDELLQRVRNLGTATLVPASTRGVLAVVKALQQGQMTVILPDQEPAREGGLFSPFFGQNALTMTLVHRLTAKTNPRILVAYARREGDGFVLGFTEPDADLYVEDAQSAADALNRSVESLVRTAPEQYQWEYKRFRKQPSDANLYRDL